ncbi:MAG: hypothetical protein K6T31_02095 [Alicyclobacillus sp.]|nr:hypothetical protein [Alicyclobacillus sp.]
MMRAGHWAKRSGQHPETVRSVPPSQQAVKSSRRESRLATVLDRYLGAVAWGFVTTLVLVQAVTYIPWVRHTLDRSAGRLVQVPTEVVPATVQSRQASVTLYLEPAVARPDVVVALNGKPVGRFDAPQLSVTVHEGDTLQVCLQAPGQVTVDVEHNDADLVWPAPGMTLTLEQPGEWVSFPKAEFAD